MSFISVINKSNFPSWIKDILLEYYSKIKMTRVSCVQKFRYRYEYFDDVLYVDLIIDIIKPDVYKHYIISIFDHKINLCILDNLNRNA